MGKLRHPGGGRDLLRLRFWSDCEEERFGIARAMLFDFLWYARGSVPIKRGASGALAMEYVGNQLDGVGKSVRYERADYAEFDGLPLSAKILMGWSSQVLVSYDQGRFGIAETSRGRVLRYEFRRLYFFLFFVVTAAAAGVGDAVHAGILSGGRSAVVVFVGFMALSKLSDATFLPRSLHRAVEQA